MPSSRGPWGCPQCLRLAQLPHRVMPGAPQSGRAGCAGRWLRARTPGVVTSDLPAWPCQTGQEVGRAQTDLDTPRYRQESPVFFLSPQTWVSPTCIPEDTCPDLGPWAPGPRSPRCPAPERAVRAAAHSPGPGHPFCSRRRSPVGGGQGLWVLQNWGSVSSEPVWCRP